MTKITIEIPEDLERKAKMFKIELSILAARAIKDQLDKLEKIERIKEIAAKSHATEKDTEELSDEVNKAMWEYHKKKYNL